MVPPRLPPAHHHQHHSGGGVVRFTATARRAPKEVLQRVAGTRLAFIVALDNIGPARPFCVFARVGWCFPPVWHLKGGQR